MSRMRVDQELCILCGQCVEACPFNGVEIRDDAVVFTESCRLCRVCVKACPVSAIWLEKSEPVSTVDKEQYKGVLVFAEQRQGSVQPVTYELIGKGLELAGKLGEQVCVYLAGSNLSSQAEDLLYYGVDRVYLYDHPLLERFRIEPYTSLMVELIDQIKPNIILMGATPVGRSLAPRVAARLRTGLTADCTLLDVKPNGDLVQTRPAFGGDVMAQIVTPRHRPQMATVRYKVMPAAERISNPHGEVVRCPVDERFLQSGIEILGFKPHEAASSITDAEVIVAAGRGIGKPEGLELLGELAGLLGGVVGVTRPLVEQGWADYTQQIGMSGRTVRPKLYIACGISGAIQHVAGMRGSEVIFAINTDPHAPIFDTAHYGLVGDLYEIVPALIEAIKKGGSFDAVFQAG
ncbi:MAG TPA: electron transfer flavoprotein subunit alpha [Firmicutes bacterium]|nr:electron transfer flavoprotein subunit alpha [Bacillota bacterium]